MTNNKTTRKIRYRDRLRAHPGKGVATIFTLAGGLMGAANENTTLLTGAVMGAFFTGVVSWGIVLLTARTQPVREDEL